MGNTLQITKELTKEGCKTNELQLIKAEHFGDIEADIYSNGTGMFMTAAQLAKCLGYSDKSAFNKFLSRNPELKGPEFSGSVILTLPQGNGFSSQYTRVFNEDGIYEITFLSKTEKAREFRHWVRNVLKSLRSGELMLSNGSATVSPAAIEAALAHLGLSIKTILFWNERLGAIEGLVERCLELQQENACKTIEKHNELTNGQKVLAQYLNRIYQSCYPPFNISNWKKEVYKTANAIVKANPNEYVDFKAVLSTFYKTMRDTYGFVEEQARKEYREKHNTTQRLSTLDLIAEDSTLRKIFLNILTDEANKDKMLSDYNDVEEYKSIDKKLIEKLIALRNDKSPHGGLTYRLVYDRMMSAKQWNYKIGGYKRKFKVKTSPQKIKMIEMSNELQKLFEEKAKELISEIENRHD